VSLAAARAASEALDVAALSAVGVEVESLGEGGASKPRSSLASAHLRRTRRPEASHR
jgi:hypothetical protein